MAAEISSTFGSLERAIRILVACWILSATFETASSGFRPKSEPPPGCGAFMAASTVLEAGVFG